MKPSTTKNQNCNGYFVAFVEVGDSLFFDGILQTMYVVTLVSGSRPYAGSIDLFQLAKDYKIDPICFTNNEFPKK